MVSQQLVAYIRTQLQTGVSKESLTNALAQSGYQPNDIEEGFRLATQPPQGLIARTPLTAGKSHSLLFFIFLPLLVLLILGSGGYAYYAYVYNAPDKVVTRMVKKMDSLNTTVYSTDLTLSAKTEEIVLPSLPTENVNESTGSGFPKRSLGPVEINVMLKVNGAADFSDNQRSRGYYGANIDANARASGTNFGVTLALESIYSGDDLYVQFTQFPGMGFLDADMFLNQWVRINVKELAKESGRQEGDKSLSKEDQEKIKALFQNAKLFIITRTLPSEKIARVDTYHYEFMIDKAVLQDIVEQLFALFDEKLDKGEFGVKDAKEEVYKGLQEFFDAVVLDKGQLWIGRSDNYLYKVSLGASINKSEKMPISGTLSFSTTLKDHNKPVSVVAPSQYKKLEDIIGPLMGSYPITLPKGDGTEQQNPLVTPYERSVLGTQAPSLESMPILILLEMFHTQD